MSKTTWFSMSCDEDLVKHLAFAPTATDILKKISDKYAMYHVSKDDIFIVAKDGKVGAVCDTNPAEAAALAYLAIHEHHAAQPTTDTKV